MGSFWDMLTGNVDPNTVRNSQLQGMNLDAYTQRGDKYTGIGDEFLDIDSDRNQALKNNLLKMSMDAAAQSNLQTQRNMAMGGHGVPSAMINASGVANSNRMQNQGQQNFVNAFQQNQGMGAQYHNMGNQQYDTRSGYQNQANQAATNQLQQNAANTAGMIQGIGGMALNAVAPGMGSMMGFAMGGGPQAGGPQNMWQAFGQPYQWQPPNTTGVPGVPK